MHRKIAPFLAMFVVCVFTIPFLTTHIARGASDSKQAGLTVTSPKTKPAPALYPKNLSITPQSSEGGLWRTDGNFQSVMMLKNIPLTTTMSVTPVLHMADGTEYALPPVKLDMGGVAMVNLNTALQNAPASVQPHISTYGSAAIRYQWAWKDAVGASIRMGDDVGSLAYLTHLNANANETHNTASPEIPQTLEGMWWKQEPGVTGFLAMSNTSLKTVRATYQVFDSDADGPANQTIVLQPHTSQLIELAPVWSQIPGNPDQGGVRISYTGVKNALQIQGGLMDIAKGYSQKIGLSPMPQAPSANSDTASAEEGADTSAATHAISLDSTGMMIGTQDANMQFPSGTQFTPYEVLRNTSNHPLLVQLTANYPNQGVPTDLPLGTISLAPQEVQQVDVKTMLAAAGLGKYNGLMNLRTSYVGFLPDLLAEAGSVDQAMTYVFETPPLLEARSGARILSYWNTVADTDTMITLWNHSTKAEDLILTLYHQQGQYKLPIHIPANGSTSLSMAWLIKSGQPDADGNVIPSNITQGSGKLTSATRETARLQVSMHIGVFNVRTGTCTCPCVYCDTYEGQAVSPESVTELIGDETEFVAYVYLADGPADVTDEVNWQSGDDGIAQADPDGNDQGATGEGGGSTDISGSIDSSGADNPEGDSFDANSGGDCNGGQEGSPQYESICGETDAQPFDLPVTVQVPTTLQYLNVPGAPNGIQPLQGNTGSPNVTVQLLNGTVFLSNVCGAYRNFAYQLVDQNGSRIMKGTVIFQESFANVSPSQPSPSLGPGNVTVNLGGSSNNFLDDISGLFNSAQCPPPGGFTQTLDQSWTAQVANGTIYPLTIRIHFSKGTTSNGTVFINATITTP